MKSRRVVAWSVVSSVVPLVQLPFANATAREGDGPERLPLATGWSLQAAAKLNADGETLSSPRYRARGWYTVSVPTTVVAAMVERKVFPDPYFGMNIRSLPGASY